MRKEFLTISLLAVLGLGAISAAPAAEENSVPVKMPENFSLVMTVKDQKTDELQMKSQIRKLGAKQRVDLQEGGGMPLGAMGGQGGMYFVTNMDSGESFMVMPAQKMYMPMNLNQVGIGPDAFKQMMNQTQTMTYEKLGEETINGKKTVKYKATNPEDQTTLLMWVDESVNFPVQIVSETQNVKINYEEMKLEAPEAALFEIPEDFNSLGGLNPQMLEGMMKNLPKGAGGE